MAIDQSPDNTFDEFLLSPRGDKLIRISISRNTMIAIICSLLLHAIVLLLVLPQIQLNNASAPPSRAIEVSLAPPTPPKAVEQLPPEPLPEPQPEKPAPKVTKTTPKVMTQKHNSNAKPSFTVPDVLAVPKPSPEVVPPAKDAPTDMMAYVNQQRAKRQASEADAAKQNADAVARELGPTEEQKRDERIKSNFQNGTNGIFEITSLNGRNATFTFLGWTTSLSNAKKQFFEVEAKSGQDVRLMMIKRMISLIREHYQGDFDWDSHRLARVVKLSARPEDSAGLEDFMMTEFFGSNYKN
jgi:outer membrane biosynthesis protein TonB